MRVRCINIFNIHTKEFQTKSPHLTIGWEYIILEIYSRPDRGILYRLIGDDKVTPALFDSKQFEISSNKIPTNWGIFQEDDRLLFTTKPWSKIGFWEDYFDIVAEARATYEKEKQQIYLEEGIEEGLID